MQTLNSLSSKDREDFYSSIPIIRKNLDFFVVKFYSHFLKTDAGKLFHSTNLEKQYKMFHASLTIIINQLDQPNLLKDHVQKLVKIHSNYGVKKEHSDYFTLSFMKALKDVFGEKYELYQPVWLRLITEIMNYFANGV